MFELSSFFLFLIYFLTSFWNKFAFRKNYAGIGFTYDEAKDAFIPPKPFNSWVLDNATCLWQAPTPMPTDDKNYEWSEDDLTWKEVE